jgi:hypothetical protein
VPGIGVAKTVDVIVKKNLARAHSVALKDGGKSVVMLVEAKVEPVGTDRSCCCRKGVTRAVVVAGCERGDEFERE